ncbi:hypothetical protein DNU06_00100 [Putridiphycobacter roseus]|uniref:histidine kinase n=1 Tax=Putridiphycobacter roseus TaxID=2219161 RepID=A0A2W1NRM1_9FLAO|nr:CHASE domain-containing protein [Putridiphycobacter roseus]PZE18272.1 hypothetical protein DNU06_00100 [Putridiphycobacter roseus]
MNEKKNSFLSIFHNAYTAWVILFVSICLTILAWWISSNFSEQLAKDRFFAKADEVAIAIDERMITYEQALWGGIALFNSSDEVTRLEWRNYVNTLDINNRLPGIQGMGYAIPIANEAKDSFELQMIKDGFFDFKIKPEGVRDTYTSILYLEPFDWRNKRAFGYDMWSNEMRQSAMQRAIDSGEASTSSIITLVQETETDVQKGFLTYLPVYKKGADLSTVANRNKFFKGWVYSPFRVGDLMKGILGENVLGFDYELYDDDQFNESNLLFDSDSLIHLLDHEHQPDLTIQIPISIQGRDWVMYAHSTEKYITRGERLLPRVVAFFGFVIDVLLFFVIYSIQGNEKKARLLALEMTKDIREKTKELERSNKELSEYAYITSHDLQEPLGTIKSLVEIIVDENEDNMAPETKMQFGFIKDSAQRMSNMIRSLLELSRIGKNAVKQEVDIQQVLVDVKADLSNKIKEVNGKVSWEGKFPKVIGYEAELRMLFQNLISNGLKFKRKEINPEIHISYQFKNGMHEFFVADNGIGIPEKHHEKIFNIFNRLHDKSTYEGEGIGLAHCKKIVDLHQGEISVNSTINEGTTFKISLNEK